MIIMKCEICNNQMFIDEWDGWVWSCFHCGNIGRKATKEEIEQSEKEASEMGFVKRTEKFMDNVKVLDKFHNEHGERWDVLGYALLLEAIGYIEPDDFEEAIARVEKNEQIANEKA